jgi:hypothetical protein
MMSLDKEVVRLKKELREKTKNSLQEDLEAENELHCQQRNDLHEKNRNLRKKLETAGLELARLRKKVANLLASKPGKEIPRRTFNCIYMVQFCLKYCLAVNNIFPCYFNFIKRYSGCESKERQNKEAEERTT